MRMQREPPSTPHGCTKPHVLISCPVLQKSSAGASPIALTRKACYLIAVRSQFVQLSRPFVTALPPSGNPCCIASCATTCVLRWARELGRERSQDTGPCPLAGLHIAPGVGDGKSPTAEMTPKLVAELRGAQKAVCHCRERGQGVGEEMQRGLAVEDSSSGTAGCQTSCCLHNCS